MAVTAANHQIPGEGQVLQQRRPDLDEPLVYTYGGVERLLRAAGSGQLTAVGGVIRLVEHGLVAVLHAEVDAKPLTRRRQLEAGFAEPARWSWEPGSPDPPDLAPRSAPLCIRGC